MPFDLIIRNQRELVKKFGLGGLMQKEEKTDKTEIKRKFEVHFIENVEESEEACELRGEPQQPEPADSIEPIREEAAAKSAETQGTPAARKPEVSKKRRAGRKEKTEEAVARRVTGEAQSRHPAHCVRNTLLGILVLLIAAASIFGYPIGKEYFRQKSVAGKDVEVVIAKGSTSREVGKILKKKGVIQYESAFLLKLYFSDYKGKLRYGTFELNDGMSLDQVIKELATQTGEKKETTFTMPEGYTIEMTAAKLEKEGIMSAEEFLTAVENAVDTFKYKDILPDKTKVFYQLQGYLYPDTYYLSDDMTGEQLVKMMLEEFDKKFDASRKKKAKQLGFSVEEVLIRASLAQKETEKPEEYARIAGVIQNRLDKGMKLQFDSTAVYAITKGMFGKSRVLYSDLKIDSPYNTYKYQGLPIGPICNPDQEAIDGVLNPEKHDYLYFQTDQTKSDGSNLFSKTYEEHQAASATTEEQKVKKKSVKEKK